MWSAWTWVNPGYLFVFSGFLFSSTKEWTTNTIAMEILKHILLHFQDTFPDVELLGDVLFKYIYILQGTLKKYETDLNSQKCSRGSNTLGWQTCHMYPGIWAWSLATTTTNSEWGVSGEKKRASAQSSWPQEPLLSGNSLGLWLCGTELALPGPWAVSEVHVSSLLLKGSSCALHKSIPTRSQSVLAWNERLFIWSVGSVEGSTHRAAGVTFGGH